MKTITITPEEAKIIREDVESTLRYLDDALECHGYESPQEREEDIAMANSARNILKKLGEE